MLKNRLRNCLIIYLILLSYINNVKSYTKLEKGVNGGIGCATCTVIVALVEQLSIVYNTTIEESLDKFCNYLPAGLFRFTCLQAVQQFGPVIINGLYLKETPDVVCQTLKFCKINDQPECRLFPNPKPGLSLKQQTENFETYLVSQHVPLQPIRFSICNETIMEKICDFFARSLAYHEPSVDIDVDTYSEYQTLRGAHWRGKDCNDLSAQSYPGAKPRKSDVYSDSNCNGILGKDASDRPYEDLFCKESNQKGIAVVGDQTSAHFHLPEEWFDAKKVDEKVFEHIADIVADEFDWPYLSYVTGHLQNQWPVIQGNTSSLYLKLWERNKCNFRDFQNVAANGISSKTIFEAVPLIGRNRFYDQPLIIVYSLTTNDVCNSYPDTFAHMTTPDEMYNNVLETLKFLDYKVPFDSHILFTGLSNASYVYEQLFNRTHPIGRVRNDVRYSDFHSYLSCLQISPCNGWLTTNDTIRQMTTAYAAQLSNVIQNITQSYKFDTFDMAYYDFPIQEIVDRWIHMGRQPWELLEPVDGFHLNQYAQALVADSIWDFLYSEYHDWLGPENPYNELITEIFGDQGGY